MKSPVDTLIARVHEIAPAHGQRVVLLVMHDVVTGQTAVSSPIDDPRDVRQIVQSVLDLVSRDADRVVATGAHCTHARGDA